MLIFVYSITIESNNSFLINLDFYEKSIKLLMSTSRDKIILNQKHSQLSCKWSRKEVPNSLTFLNTYFDISENSLESEFDESI